MAERAGYRVKRGNWMRSDILRKALYIVDDMDLLVADVANTLANGHVIGSYQGALRNDLGIGRLTAALFSTMYDPPFDSIEFDDGDRIADCGLYEIELVEWNHWKVWHHEIDYTGIKYDTTKLLAEVRFEEGKSVEDGMKFMNKEK